MKKFIFVILSLNFIFSDDVCDVKGVKGFEFGMSEDLARKNEMVSFKYNGLQDLVNAFSDLQTVEQAKKYETLLSNFTTKFAGYDGDGSLIFTDKGLMGIFVKFDIETSNKNKYIDAYFEIKGLLTKKYGDATMVYEHLEYPYEDDYPRGDHAGTALSVGKGSYLSAFQCKDDEKKYIQLYLYGDNYELSFALSYFDKNYDKSEEEKLKESLDDF